MGGGRYIACGYSQFDDIGLGGLYTNDPCNRFAEINFNDPGFDILNFELPDMRHMNTCGTVGLVNLTRTSSASNPYVWIYNYGLGSSFTKVIPTSDGGFLATGSTIAFNTPYPSVEPQFANFQSSTNAPQAIKYQSPSATTGYPNEINAFQFPDCPATDPTELEDPLYQVKKNHACLLKVNADGIAEWFYTYGIVPFTDTGNVAYLNSSLGTDIREVSDGYILVGVVQNSPVFGNLGNHGMLLKVNALGILQWINQYHDTGFLTEKFTAIDVKNDSTIYVTGERTNMNVGLSLFCSTHPNGCPCLNGSGYADIEHYRSMKFLPFLKKINTNTQNELWDFPLATNTAIDYRVRSLSIDINENILVALSSACSVNYASGECAESKVCKIKDNLTAAALDKDINFGPLRAYDLSTGLGVKATSDGGFIVVGTKKAYNININKNYSASPFGSGYNMSDFDQTYVQTDAFVAKCNDNADIEWTTIFDNKSLSPGGNPLTSTGNPRNVSNLDSWMNHQVDRSKKDIKRQECLYSIATSYNGEIIVGGNMSGNIDDCYIAMVDNNCDLTLSNHLIQSIPSVANPSISITDMDNFIATNIITGRAPGNTNDEAFFDVNNGAVIKLDAGEDITMYENSDLEIGTDIEASINPSHTCNAGAVYARSTDLSESRKSIALKKDKFKVPVDDASISAYPNPTSGMVTIKHPSEIKYLELYNSVGKAIKLIRNNRAFQTILDLSNLSNGLYVVRIQGKYIIKILKYK